MNDEKLLTEDLKLEILKILNNPQHYNSSNEEFDKLVLAYNYLHVEYVRKHFTDAMNLEFIKDFEEHANWELISKLQSLSPEFIKTFKHKLISPINNSNDLIVRNLQRVIAYLGWKFESINNSFLVFKNSDYFNLYLPRNNEYTDNVKNVIKTIVELFNYNYKEFQSLLETKNLLHFEDIAVSKLLANLTNKGLFITFEGIDGSGKSTQIENIYNYFKSQNIATIKTREPGGTKISEKIRTIILDNDNAEMTTNCEILLYLASRAQHVEEVITPNLNNGVNVLCDRFSLSTLTYQGFGRQVDYDKLEQLKQLNDFATSKLLPDLVFIFDIPVETAIERTKHKNKDRLESCGIDFFQRIRDGFLHYAFVYNNIVIIDALQPIEIITKIIIDKIESFRNWAVK